jgi:hypothetical protein
MPGLALRRTWPERLTLFRFALVITETQDTETQDIRGEVKWLGDAL